VLTSSKNSTAASATSAATATTSQAEHSNDSQNPITSEAVILESLTALKLKHIKAHISLEWDHSAGKELPVLKVISKNGQALAKDQNLLLVPLVAERLTFSTDIHPSAILSWPDRPDSEASRVMVANHRTDDFKSIYQHRPTMQTYASAATWSGPAYETNANGFIRRSDQRMRNNTFLGTWLAYQGPQAVGFFHIGMGYQPQNLQVAYAVHQSAQGRSMGSSMVGAMFQEYLPYATAAGLKPNGQPVAEVEATVLKTNGPSQNLLERAAWMNKLGDDPGFEGKTGENPRLLYAVAMKTIKTYKELMDGNSAVDQQKTPEFKSTNAGTALKKAPHSRL